MTIEAGYSNFMILYPREPVWVRTQFDGCLSSISFTLSLFPFARSSKWVIADYTRDPEILGAMAGDPAVLTLVSVKGQDKLK